MPGIIPRRPLASRSRRNLLPLVFVDDSGDIQVKRETMEIEPMVRKEDEAIFAAKEWASSPPPEIKSWFYPMDAFDPWPKKTDLCCWWCTLNFDWTPFPLPFFYDVKNGQYKTVGMFCGPSCAKAYAATKDWIRNTNVLYFINAIAAKYYGYSCSQGKCPNIPTAPPREILQKFCGPRGFSPEQYRKLLWRGRSLEILQPGWVTFKQIVCGEQNYAKTRPVFHYENADMLQRTEDVLKTKRIPYVGKNVKRITDYLRQRT